MEIINLICGAKIDVSANWGSVKTRQDYTILSKVNAFCLKYSSESLEKKMACRSIYKKCAKLLICNWFPKGLK